MSKTRVEATQEKIELLTKVKYLINDFRKKASDIEEQIDVMIDADLVSMEGEKNIIEQMAKLIQNGNKKG